MLLSKILEGVEILDGLSKDVDVPEIEIVSDKVTKGGMFIALKGKTSDGKDYIPDAIKYGAGVIAYDGEYNGPKDKAIFVRLGGNMRENVAHMTKNFYLELPPLLSAITGTNGKTSIADFTRQMMTNLGYHSASIGTIGVVSDVMKNIETITTPNSVALHHILTRLAKRGVNYVSMEASSAGIEQYRMDGLNIQVAGFTNFTQDHLDYHLTMENYFEAKKQLFSRILQPGSTAVLNADIPEFETLNKVCRDRGIKVMTYGKNGSELKLLDRKANSNGQSLNLEILGQKYQVELPLIGAFQAMNVLCAVGMVISLNGGMDSRIMDYIPHLKGACGRLDKVGNLPNGAAVYVDYAHTPDALENVLNTMREHTAGKLWIMFGCGGNRDALKRPIMGEIANRLADRIIITDDNPRNEDPAIIRHEIMQKCPKAREIPDRIKAMKYAISHLEAGDMLILAGKGHETGQQIGDKKIPMNDIVEAKRIISKLHRNIFYRLVK